MDTRALVELTYALAERRVGCRVLGLLPVLAIMRRDLRRGKRASAQTNLYSEELSYLVVLPTGA